jgi:hypothetical protein
MCTDTPSLGEMLPPGVRMGHGPEVAYHLLGAAHYATEHEPQRSESVACGRVNGSW